MGDLLVHALHLWRPRHRSVHDTRSDHKWAWLWNDHDNYFTLLASLAQLGSLEACSDLSCAGGDYSIADGWEGRVVSCSENCRLCHEFDLFAREIGIRNY